MLAMFSLYTTRPIKATNALVTNKTIFRILESTYKFFSDTISVI